MSNPLRTPPPTPAPPPPPGRREWLPGAGLLRLRREGMLGTITGLAREYGDFAAFRLGGRPFCLVSDPEAIRRIVVTDNAMFTKSHALAAVKTALGDGLLTADGELHTRQRRMIAPVFHATQVKQYADGFVAQAARTADEWRDGETIDLGRAMTALTLRVVTQSLFGVELDDEVGPIGRDMEIIVGMFERLRNPVGFVLDRLPMLPSNRRYRAAMARLDARIAAMTTARRDQAAADPAAAAARADLLSLLLMARDAHGGSNGGTADGESKAGGMSERQARDEAVTLFMAGHETTANALIWTWLLLAEHPAAEAALHAELDAVLTGRAATADDVPGLRVTRAVLAESMRLRPPAWVIGRLCTRDYDLGPYRVAAGTTLLMSQYLVHRDPRWWPDPEAFRPDRWLDDAGAGGNRNGNGNAARPKYAYFPFGGGARSCVGEPFAWLEAVLLLATLARRWRLSRSDTTPVELFPTITLRPKGTVRMTVHARTA